MNKRIGAHYKGKGVCEFNVWAPNVNLVNLDIISPEKRSVTLKKDNLGYWSSEVDNVHPGSLYYFSLNNDTQRPDPASRFQPEGVHGPSQVIDPNAFAWTDTSWKGIPMKEMIIYELHVGTFTPEGTFEGVISKLNYLTELGINTIELMPLSQFPGNRNWGYDGVCPFAVQNSYGGPDGLKKLVNACHQKGIAVVVDAVYNHMGPEGNYLSQFGPYFTDKYATPWGQAINFDDAHCDEVRNYFIQNAMMWFRDYHVDALRLDAVHAIKDFSAKHFLQELAEQIKYLGKESGRIYTLIGESDLNDPKFINPLEKGGFGLDGQWCDEFHHAVHSIVTGETDGYYSDFGKFDHLRRAFQNSYVYTGNYSPHRKKSFGMEPKENPYNQFVVFAQNHDQIGNRMLGDRISKLVSYEQLKLTAGAVLISPYVPLLFMGEEFGEENPFLYFVSHTDPQLVEAVRNGRKKEFEYFNWQGEVPDPFSDETFNKSKLNWHFKEDKKKSTLWEYYKKLIELRKKNPAFKFEDRTSMKVEADDSRRILTLERFSIPNKNSFLYCIMNFSADDTEYRLSAYQGKWQLYLDSADDHWFGEGSYALKEASIGDVITVRKHSILIYERTQ